MTALIHSNNDNVTYKSHSVEEILNCSCRGLPRGQTGYVCE